MKRTCFKTLHFVVKMLKKLQNYKNQQRNNGSTYNKYLMQTLKGSIHSATVPLWADTTVSVGPGGTEEES